MNTCAPFIHYTPLGKPRNLLTLVTQSSKGTTPVDKTTRVRFQRLGISISVCIPRLLKRMYAGCLVNGVGSKH